MKSTMEEGATAAETVSESPQMVQKKQAQQNGSTEKRNGNSDEISDDSGSANGSTAEVNGSSSPPEGEEISSSEVDTNTEQNSGRDSDSSGSIQEGENSKKEKKDSDKEKSKSKSKDKTPSASSNGAQAAGPNKEATDALVAKTGYSLEVTSGQRKYGGPPPDWEKEEGPGAGHEVFIGKLPKDVYEVDLVPILEPLGRIWDLRIMIDPVTGLNRGYAFVTFCEKDDAQNAVAKLDGHQIRKGKSLKANISVPNVRLFVGNIPKSKSRQEIMEEFAKITDELVQVIVYTSPEDRKKNRGFCFLEYDSHKTASQAKRKLSSGRIRVWNCDILVDWADPQEEPDDDTMSKVKVLYVRNLTSDSTEESLRTLFEPHGQVERVKKIKDYAFVHFLSRDSALRGMEQLDGTPVNGVKMEVSLAKPPSDKRKKEEMLRNRERRVMIMMQQRSMNSVVPSRLTPLLPAPPHHSHLMPWMGGWMGHGASAPPAAMAHWFGPSAIAAAASHPGHPHAPWNAILHPPPHMSHSHPHGPPPHDIHGAGRSSHNRSGGLGGPNHRNGGGDGNQASKRNGGAKGRSTNGSGSHNGGGSRNGNSNHNSAMGNNHGSGWQQPYHY